MTNNDNNHDDFDDKAFAAGRALQEPAPAGGLARVRSSYRRRRVATVAAVGASVLLVGVGVFALARNGDDSTVADLPTDTIPGVSTSAAPPTSVVVSETTPSTTATTVEPSTTAAPSTTPTTVKPKQEPVATPAPKQTPSTTQAAKSNGAAGQMLFWQWGYLGRWNGSTFDASPTPAGMVGSTVNLRNLYGETYQGTVVECGGTLQVYPTPPESDGADGYWYTDGAPFKSTTFDDDDASLAAMNDALVARGLDPANADSFPAPLAADGSADRLLTYHGPNDPGTWWIATFDVESKKFTTIDGDPNTAPEMEFGGPSRAFTDIDGDGNLESAWGMGDTPMTLHEWATGEDMAFVAPLCGN